MDDFRLKLVTRAWLRVEVGRCRIERHWHPWSQCKRDCFNLCELVLSGLHPSPSGYRLAQLLLHNPKPDEMQLGIAHRTLVMCWRILPGLWIFFSRPTLQFQEYKSGEVRFISRRFSMRLMNKSVWNLNAQGYYNTSSYTMSILQFSMLLENHVFFLIIFQLYLECWCLRLTIFCSV